MIITKERDDKLRRTEFPKLILEDENISRQESIKNKDKTLTTREIITFLIFCGCFMIAVYMQLSIGDAYSMNQAIKTSLAQNSQAYLDINIEDSYWTWLNGFISGFYTDEYYEGFPVPDNFKYALANYDVLISPVRITQRRMRLVENTDQFTSAYIQEGWASYGFDYLDSLDTEQETTDTFGTNETFSYQVEGSFQQKGGYMVILDILTLSQDDALQKVADLQNSGFIDKQTRIIVIDCVLHNIWTYFYTTISFVAVFEANGLITTTIDLNNVKQDYYTEFKGYFRMVCEIIFLLLLIYYFIVEILEIIQDIRDKKKEYEKAQKKKQARENRKQEQLENNMQSQQHFESGIMQTPEIARNANSFANKQNLNEFSTVNKQKNDTKKKVCLNFFSFIVKGLKEHYKSGWNWIDSAFLILSLVATCLWGYIISQHIQNIQQYGPEYNKHSTEKNDAFQQILYYTFVYTQVCAVNVLLIFIKVLKYLASWFERVMIIFKTLAWAQSDIFYFLIMYIIIFFAFVVMCHIYYGADLSTFGSIFDSLTTLFLMLLGDLDYLDDMIVLNKVLSFFFFIAFMTSMQFILINMFIAFISNAYSEVNITISSSKKLEDELKEKHWIVRMQGCWQWMKKKLNRNKKLAEVEKAKELKAQETFKKNMAKKLSMMIKLNSFKKEDLEKDQSYDKRENPLEPAELPKLKSIFGPGPSDNKKSEFNKQHIENEEDFEAIITKHTLSPKKINVNQLVKSIKIEDIGKKGSSTEENDSSNNKSKTGDEDKDEIYGDLIGEGDDEQTAQNKKKMEEEKAKNILTRKEWDKNFDQNQFFVEEPMIPALLSEKQDVIGKKDRELKCGKIMWASITFTLYAALYITIILVQLNVERNYWYNTAMENAIESASDPNQMTLSGFQSYADLVSWLNFGFINIATEKNISSSNFTGYYINDVNYVLGGKFRFCFTTVGYRYYNDTDPSHFGIDPSGYPMYLLDIVGHFSGTTYKYDQEGFQGAGGQCFEVSFQQSDYMYQIENLIADQIIDESINQMSIEFVTFEASQYVHTYSSIKFRFFGDGRLTYETTVFTMKLDQYKTNGDKVRLGFEGLYIILLIYNIIIFCRKLISKNNQYKRWKRIEIDSLSEIERNQRHQKRPEWLRQFDAVFTAFTYFDMIYFSMSIASIALWIAYIQQAQQLDFPLPPPDDEVNYINKFYYVKKTLMTYTNIVAINTIFLSVKVFDYMNKSKHMNMLSNTLYSSREDTFYFLIIFTLFLFGFVGMSFLSFGQYLEDYNSIGNAVRKCFEITIGDFSYEDLKGVNSAMAVIFFFPFNILFVFILTNIFLAIINEAYEANQLSSEDYDNINILQSVFYCMIPNEKNKSKRRKTSGVDKKSSQNDYLEVFEKLVVNLQISMSDLKAWAINCADEIKSELKTRTQLRHENREILFNKFKKLKSLEEGKSLSTGVTSSSKRYDEVECYKKRLQYWDYIRNGIQFISFQNKILQAVLRQKEKEIQEKTEQYYKEKERTKEIYKYLALLEKPVEDRLEQIMNYRRVLNLLEQEKNLLIKEEEKDEEEEEEIENHDKKSKSANAEQSEKSEKDQDVMSEYTTKNLK